MKHNICWIFFFFFLVTAAEDDRLCWGKDSCRLCEARFGETVELQLFSLTSAAVHEGAISKI